MFHIIHLSWKDFTSNQTIRGKFSFSLYVGNSIEYFSLLFVAIFASVANFFARSQPRPRALSYSC